jgi:uncharacterized protein RhaS with RHS repeats
MRGVPSLKAGRSIPSYPSLGRFLSRDPIGFAGGLNLYEYAGNSPVDSVDPDGLIAQAIPIGWGLAEVGGAIWGGIEAYGGRAILASAYAYAGKKIADAAPPVEVFAQLLPVGAGSPSADHRHLSRPWDDASIYGPGRFNLAMSSSSGGGSSKPCPQDGSGGGARPPNLTPPGGKRRGAFRAAKRNSGIPVSSQPILREPYPNRDKNFGPGEKWIFKPDPRGPVVEVRRETGHAYSDKPLHNRGPHFNDIHGGHYDY